MVDYRSHPNWPGWEPTLTAGVQDSFEHFAWVSRVILGQNRRKEPDRGPRRWLYRMRLGCLDLMLTGMNGMLVVMVMNVYCLRCSDAERAGVVSSYSSSVRARQNARGETRWPKSHSLTVKQPLHLIYELNCLTFSDWRYIARWIYIHKLNVRELCLSKSPPPVFPGSYLQPVSILWTHRTYTSCILYRPSYIE